MAGSLRRNISQYCSSFSFKLHLCAFVAFTFIMVIIHGSQRWLLHAVCPLSWRHKKGMAHALGPASSLCCLCVCVCIYWYPLWRHSLNITPALCSSVSSLYLLSVSVSGCRVWCRGSVAVSAIVPPSPHEDKQGGHYQAQGQTPHSVLSHNITPPPSPSSSFTRYNTSSRKNRRSVCTCYSSHSSNQTSLRRIYHSLSLSSSPPNVSWFIWNNSNRTCWLGGREPHEDESGLIFSCEICPLAFLTRLRWDNKYDCHVFSLNV